MTIRERAERLTAADLRRVGVPSTVMSDFEFAAAMHRDATWRMSDLGADVSGYDRRGLLNVIGYLVDLLDRPGL